jgi:hypothetical protein
VRLRYRFVGATIEGGIRGGETVAGEAGGLPLDTRTASRSAAPDDTLFLCWRSTNTHRFSRYIAGRTHFLTLEDLRSTNARTFRDCKPFKLHRVDMLTTERMTSPHRANSISPRASRVLPSRIQEAGSR